MTDLPENLVNNETLHRFEMPVEGQTAWMQYRKAANRFTLIHTEVPPELRGKGIAAALVEKVLQYIETKGWKIVVLCSYVQSYLHKHPEWERLLDKGIHVKGFDPESMNK